jgi:hypothetical protein
MSFVIILNLFVISSTILAIKIIQESMVFMGVAAAIAILNHFLILFEPQRRRESREEIMFFESHLGLL